MWQYLSIVPFMLAPSSLASCPLVNCDGTNAEAI